MSKNYNKEFKLNAVDLVLRKKLTCIQASQSLGIGLSTLKRWVRDVEAHGVSQAFPGSGNLRLEDEKRRQFKREIEVLCRERNILKKSTGHLLLTIKQKYQFMRNNVTEWKVEEMARVLGVSRSSYYHFCQGKVSKRQQTNGKLKEMINTIFFKK